MTDLPIPASGEGLLPVTQAIALIDEINKRSASRQFYGISQALHAKLCTIRATLARHRLATRPPEPQAAGAGLREALQFYAEEWESELDAERTESGWIGEAGIIVPSENLFNDEGRRARAILAALSEPSASTPASGGEVELAHHYRTTCPCTAAQRHMPDCPKHGATPAQQSRASLQDGSK